MSGLSPLAVLEPLDMVATARPVDQQAVRVLILGTGTRAVRLAKTLAAQGIIVVGAIDDDPQPALAAFSPDVPWLGGTERLVAEAITRHVDELHVALPLRSGFDAWVRAQNAARQVGIPAVFEFDFINDIDSKRIFTSTGPVPLVHYNCHPSRFTFGRLAKRCVDVTGASLLLLLLLPVLVVSALAVKLSSPGPVFFRQARVGLGRRPFQMIKFRTMVSGAHAQHPQNRMDPTGILSKVAGDPRVTRVGAWLRRTSIDELPQLLNVLMGDMSLVGPRPLPTWVYEQVQDVAFHRRFAVLPGITGLWQVASREQSFEQMARLDLAYVDDWSVWLDLSILLRTPLAVLRGTGAY